MRNGRSCGTFCLMNKRAILSVYDKSGLVELGHGLIELGWELIASGGTAQRLRTHGLPVTDVAAITGALAGASVGQSGIPKEWLDGLIEWPRSVYWMENLTARLAQQFPEHGDAEIVGPLPIFWPGQLLRNLVFAILVLGHGFRRIFPPY